MTRPETFRTLSAVEGRALVDAHPELSMSSENGVVAVVTAQDSQEMAALAALIQAARASFRLEKESADLIMRALLPVERLTVTGSVISQVHRDAELRAGLAEEFGLLSAADVAQHAGSRASNARALAYNWRTQARIFAVPTEQQQRFPGFQFDDEGQPHQAVASVISELGELLTPWELALWFVGDNTWLGGTRPSDVLGDSPEEVATAAHALAVELLEEAAGRDTAGVQ